MTVAGSRVLSSCTCALGAAIAATIGIGSALADPSAEVERFVAFMRERAIHPLCFGDPCPPTTLTLATFNFNASDPRAVDRESLRSFVVALADPRVRSLRQTFRIECFTDSSGDARYNRQLSQLRYEAVAAALTTLDVAAAARVSGGGSGVAPGRAVSPAADRRCELSVVGGFSPVR